MLTELYYSTIDNIYTQEDYNITSNTIGYLLDNNISKEWILFFFKTLNGKPKIEISDIPDDLWNGSLIIRNKFYYHNSIHILSKPSIYNPITKEIKTNNFFIEMKIMYTINDICNYFYSLYPSLANYKNKNKDIGTIKYLLNDLKKYNFIDPLDFILFLIDYSFKDEEIIVVEIMDITKAQSKAFELLKTKVDYAKSLKKDRIIWR